MDAKLTWTWLLIFSVISQIFETSCQGDNSKDSFVSQGSPRKGSSI